jgi:hypothetical protein
MPELVAIAATLATITGELASADPDAAVGRLVRFLSTADRVFGRIDDSNGRLQNVYHEAAAALPGGSSKLIRLQSRIGFSL